MVVVRPPLRARSQSPEHTHTESLMIASACWHPCRESRCRAWPPHGRCHGGNRNRLCQSLPSTGPRRLQLGLCRKNAQSWMLKAQLLAKSGPRVIRMTSSPVSMARRNGARRGTPGPHTHRQVREGKKTSASELRNFWNPRDASNLRPLFSDTTGFADKSLYRSLSRRHLPPASPVTSRIGWMTKAAAMMDTGAVRLGRSTHSFVIVSGAVEQPRMRCGCTTLPYR